MAVAVDAVGPSSSGATAALSTSLTWSHTCTGTNLLLVVGLAVGGGQTTHTTTATYNGVSMTSAGRVFSNNQNDGYVELFYLAAPATGANTVAITSSNPNNLEGGSVSFTGVDQTTPVSNTTSAFGSGTAPSVGVTSATGNMVVDAVCCGSPITSSNQTLQWLANFSSTSAGGNGAQSTAAGASSVTMSYVVSSDWWGIMATSVNAATGGGGGGVLAAWLTG